MAEEKSPSGDFAYLDANGGSHSKRSPSDNVGQQQRQQRHNNTALAQQRRKQHGDTSSAGVRAEGVAAHASTFVSPQRAVSPRGACSAGAAAFSKGAYRNCANAIDGFGIGQGAAGGSRAVVAATCTEATKEIAIDDPDASGRATEEINKATRARKRKWTEDEDQNLIAAVGEHGPKNWPSVANSIPGRNGKQSRERCDPARL